MNFRFRSVPMLLAGTLVACSAAVAAPASGDGSRQVGPFEINARVRSSGDSGRFLRSGNPFGSRSVREYEVRWNGRPVELPVIGKRSGRPCTCRMRRSPRCWWSMARGCTWSSTAAGG